MASRPETSRSQAARRVSARSSDGRRMARPAASDARPLRRRDGVRTRQEILDVATREFADRGYAGARVDEIAARTRTTKRMIYYYFGGKEQLYIEVLERAYATARDTERAVDVDHLDPLAAI